MSKQCCSTDVYLKPQKKEGHQHKYDAQGNQLCCLKTEKEYTKTGVEVLLEEKSCSE